MREQYITLRGFGTGEYEEKKSRFVGEAAPVATEAEAMDFIESAKLRHSGASHGAFAYLCGETGLFKKCSDAGEPRGTAGAPILDVIEKSGMSDAVIVVTRYFGGTLLGAAGLIRSYGKAATLAVAESGIVIKSLARRVAFTVELQSVNTVRYMLDKSGYAIESVAYGIDAEIVVISPDAEAGLLRAKITELTAGAVLIEEIGYTYIDTIKTGNIR